MNNNEIFYLIIYKVVVEIFEKFPDDVYFGVDDLLSNEECRDEELRLKFCYNTMLWLQVNNYIIVKSPDMSPSWGLVIPTDKLMSLMNTKLPKLKNNTFMTFLSSVKDISFSTIQQVVTELIVVGATRFIN